MWLSSLVLRNLRCVSMIDIWYKYRCMMSHKHTCTAQVSGTEALCELSRYVLKHKQVRFIHTVQCKVNNAIFLQVLPKQCGSCVLQLYFCRQLLLMWVLFLTMNIKMTQEKFYVLNWSFKLFSVLTELPIHTFSEATTPLMVEGLAAQDGYVVF